MKTLDIKKVPSSSGFRRTTGLSGISSPSTNELGTNKPLLTSFHNPKTGKVGNSYRPGFRMNKAWMLLADLAIVLTVSLLSPYVTLVFSQKSANGNTADSAFLVHAQTANQISIWWPTDQAVLSGTQPFKALVDSANVNDYRMYWQVDGGQQNEMQSNFTDYPHKEASVDLSGWNWKGEGPYTLTFSAYDFSGQKIAEQNAVIYVSQVSAPIELSSAFNQPVTDAAPAAGLPSCPPAGNNVFVGCYYQGRNFDSFVLSRQDPTMNFDWGGSSPDPVLPSDNFSARWQGNYKFSAGKYTFVTTADDGVRIYVDNKLLIDQFKDQPITTYEADINLSAGTHSIKMEYYENSGSSVAKLSWKPVAAPVGSPVPATTVAYSGNPFAGTKLYLDPNSNAKLQADAWRLSRPQDATMMDKISSQPNAVWLGGWNGDVKNDVNKVLVAAASQGAMPIFIVYNIPNRDCGGYSAGGTQTADAYKQWVRAVAAGIGNRKAAVVLEPDGVALTDCLSASELQTRYDLLKDATAVLKSLPQTAVYIDAGHPNWISADVMASKLKAAGVGQANGFALNISNFTTTQDNVNYGQQVSAKIGGKHFIIDTSRNGNGPAPDNQWCNPSGRALGAKPTSKTGNSLVDALVWGKDPGGSDGQCNGGPAAGIFWPDYALGLAQRAAW